MRKVVGTVRDESGAPLAHIRVDARADALRTTTSTMTDAEGRFKFEVRPTTYQLAIDADGYCTTWHNVDARRGDKTVSVTLQRGTTLRGRVVTCDGHPVPHAAVRSVTKDVVADADGAFEIRGVPEQKLMLSAWAPGWASNQRRVVDGCDIVVDHAFAIRGRAVRHEARLIGIPNARVRFMAEGEWPVLPFSRATDADGQFEAWVPPGIYRVLVEADDRLIEAGMRIDATTGDVADLLFHTRRGAMLSGRVEPPALADIAVVERKESYVGIMGMNLARARAQTTVNGEFVVGPVPPGELEVSALTLDGCTTIIALDVADDDVTNLVLALETGVKVAGRVIDTAGKPVAGMFVMQRLADGPFERQFHRDGQSKFSTTDGEGRFEIVGLEREYYKVMVDDQVVEVDLTTGDKLDVVLTVPARDAAIHGRVIDEHGSPVRGLYVSASTMKRTRAVHARTDTNGAFVIAPVVSGTHMLGVADEHMIPRLTTKVTTTDAPIDLALPPLVSITIYIKHDDVPARDVFLRCMHGDIGAMYDAHNVVGSHTFDKLPADTYIVEATNADGWARDTIMIERGHATVSLVLAEFASVAGTAVDLITDVPIADLVVSASGEHTTTDDEGRFSIRVPGREGTVMFLARDQLGPQPGKYAFTAKSGEHTDAGRIPLLTPRKGPPGTFGLTFDENLVVTRVRSPAQLQVGDQVIAIDNLSVDELGKDRARLLLASEYVEANARRHIALADGRFVELTARAW